MPPSSVILPLAYLRFHSDTAMVWNLTETNFSITGTIQSPWLNLIFLLNNIGKLIGFELIQPEFAALLPVVDLHDALTVFLGDNFVSAPKYYWCVFLPEQRKYHGSRWDL